ncbi:peptide deformylase [Streptomyces sp. NPDC056660]|uniref:peptide deformylase n=1 Tax=Streptomyces sp. NPDC056660 TaxID=3345897 RepID=UPI0036A7577E
MTTADGERVRLDDVLGSRWTLLHLGPPAWERLGVESLAVLSAGSRPAGGAVVDSDGVLLPWLTGRRVTALALRPDAYVYAAAPAGTQLPPPPAGFAPAPHPATVHPFAKGMGLAAPQIGIGRAAAAVQPPEPGAGAIVLLNPRVTEASDDTDEQFEGCLSYFDVRGLVPRPLRITVETTTLDGTTVTTVYERGLARLIAHEIDHLNGLLYLSRMRPGIEPLPVEQYRQTGRSWAYDS